jgi:hypothetical protein
MEFLSVLVLDMIEILPLLGKFNYNTWRILPVKCYIDNSMCLQSCIGNINTYQVCPSSYNHIPLCQFPEAAASQGPGACSAYSLLKAPVRV